MKRLPSLTQGLALRTRLTLWYSLVFAAALLCIGVAALWMVHRAIDDLQNNELQQRVRSVRRFLEARPGNETPAELRTAIAADYNVSHGSKWLQVIDEHGSWLYRSPRILNRFPSLVLPQQAAKDPVYFTFRDAGQWVRALIEPITVHGVTYTVQTGLTLNKAMGILSSFGYQLSVLIGLGLVVSSFAGYFLSRKALTPISAIAAEVEHINDKNLNSRLPERHTRDELAALSSTLNQMLRRIDASYQSVRSFTANAAHELRTPVALLRAETEVALAFPRDADYYRSTCERVLQHSRQMSQLIDQLLALARADAGIDDLRFEPCDLSDLLITLADEWAERFLEAGIHFRLEAAASDVWVEADYLALKRLMNILIENAWRYTPTGQSVVLVLHSRSIGRVSLEVIDTGIGIAAADRERVFERFCRVAQPLHGDFTGSGLGLVLAQGIAVCHKSRLTLESTLGKGSRFSLELKEMQSPLVSSQNSVTACAHKLPASLRIRS